MLRHLAKRDGKEREEQQNYHIGHIDSQILLKMMEVVGEDFYFLSDAVFYCQMFALVQQRSEREIDSSFAR